MKRRGALVCISTLLAFAQTGRDMYRNAYRAWREADPSLERDAAISGPELGKDAGRVAGEAAKYGVERRNFLTQVAAEETQRLAWLDRPPAAIGEASDGAAEIIAAAATPVRLEIATFSNDTDRGIQRLRGMLERENAALVSLASSIEERQKAADSARQAAMAAESARVAALAASRQVITGLRLSVEESVHETAAWSDYYRTLSAAARSGAATPAEPGTASAPSLPLARYTGAWTLPAADGVFHGPQPEVVDLDVQEDNGRASGTLVARFRVAGGDPVVRLTFSGEFKDTRQQMFALETSDGAKGALELIPGPAFNLLEVNFHAEPKPGKISEANFLLVKK